ncbi:M50 family metallopeptidase [Candidatus Altiarchaeota archaeon]
MDLNLFLGVVFILGTVWLWRTKHERHAILFMIRTKHFLKLIDELAAYKPKIWHFFADAAVVFSFGGLGATYVSKFSRDKENVYWIIGLFGLGLAYVWSSTLWISLSILVSVSVAAYILSRIKNHLLNTLSCVALIISLGVSAGLPFNPILVASSILGVPAFLLITLSLHAYQLLIGATDVPGISPALPATKEGQLVITFPGTGINMPIIYFLIVIAVTMVSHELAHGILARVYNLKVKSTGILTLGIMPIGAFVEPDEKELEKRPTLEKMHLYAVGSFANMLVAIASLILIVYILGPIVGTMTYVDGMEAIAFDTTRDDYPAQKYLEEGTVIYKINSLKVNSTDAFFQSARTLKIGEPVVIESDKGTITFEAVEHPKNSSRAYMGVVVKEHIKFQPPYDDMKYLRHVLGFIAITLSWMFLINLSISLVNLLPMVPFDGGKMLVELFRIVNIKDSTVRKVISGVVAYVVIIIFINMSPLFKKLGDLILELLI